VTGATLVDLETDRVAIDHAWHAGLAERACCIYFSTNDAPRMVMAELSGVTAAGLVL
jgi:hypothetical protein